MISLTAVRSRLTDLFNNYGTDVTVTQITTSLSGDGRGDKVETTGTSTSVKGFFHDTSKGLKFNIPIAFNFDGWGIVFPYDTTVDIGYQVTVDSKVFVISNVHYAMIQNGKVLMGCELSTLRN